METDELRSILRDSGVDVWTLIDTAISVALMDDRNEIKTRRDGIVQRLYASLDSSSQCQNCSKNLQIETVKTTTNEQQQRKSPPSTPHSVDEDRDMDDDDGDDEDENQDRIYRQHRHHHHPIDEEQIKILDIKEHLEDPHQSEDSLVNLLQDLADMDITFKALQETDIGRHVNCLRKHSSSEVRRIVKQLVRKWKYLVDQWVKSSTPGGGENASSASASTLIANGDSPRQRRPQSNNNNNQVPDFAYSPNLHNGSSGSDKNNSEPERKAKVAIPRREPQTKLTQAKPREAKDSVIDPEKFASARRRLHENYQEAQNAKKQRTIQVMDLQDIPKPKSSSYFGRNKGSFQAKHW